MQIKHLLMALGLLALSGCMKRYAEPDASVPAASVTFEYIKLAKETNMIYRSFDSADCSNNDSSAQIAAFSWATSPTKTVRVTSDRPFFFRASTQTFGTAQTYQGTSLTVGSCSTMNSFTPKQGHSYRVSPTGKNATCEVEIVDTTTGELEPSSQIKQFAEACKTV